MDEIAVYGSTFTCEEVAKEKGFSMGKLQRDADMAYNTIKRMFKDPHYITTTETLGKLARA